MSRAARAAALVALIAAPLHAAPPDIRLENAWLRPAQAGQRATQVYVDIRSDQPVTLVGASSPVAQRAELVLLERPDPDPENLKVVAAIPVAAGSETRLAYLGSHIRLVEVREDIRPGQTITVELAFVDAAGERHVLSVAALARGVVLRRPDGEELPASAR